MTFSQNSKSASLSFLPLLSDPKNTESVERFFSYIKDADTKTVQLFSDILHAVLDGVADRDQRHYLLENLATMHTAWHHEKSWGVTIPFVKALKIGDSKAADILFKSLTKDILAEEHKDHMSVLSACFSTKTTEGLFFGKDLLQNNMCSQDEIDRALELSIRENWENAALILLDKVNVGAKCENGEKSLFSLACGMKNTLIAKHMIDRAENLETVINDGWDQHYLCTPLHAAVSAGHLDLIDLLLNKGATIDRENPRDLGPSSPLLWACGEANLMMLKALLARGADPLALDEDGNGALHFMGFWDDCDDGMEETELTVFKRMASLMMEHGCDPQAPNKDGVSAIQMMQKYNHDNFAAFLSREYIRKDLPEKHKALARKM